MDKNIQSIERTYKKGEVLYREGVMDLTLYDVLWGRVAVYANYGTENEKLLTEVGAEGFVGMVGFLESRPQNTTAVAMETTVVNVITMDSFGAYFQQRPAKVMSILQYMSFRLRELTNAYLSASRAFAEYVDHDRLKAEKGDWYEDQMRLYDKFLGMFGFHS